MKLKNQTNERDKLIDTPPNPSQEGSNRCSFILFFKINLYY